MRTKHLAGAAAATLAVLAGCGTFDDRPVGAAATVDVAPARLPFGSPVELRYTFERPPDGPPLGATPRVFVQFTDPDGTLLWSDDHDPPAPADAWPAGEPVSWTRAFFLPPVPYVGPVEVRAGLVDPATGARARLDADPAGNDAYRLATFEVTPQAHPLDFADGWYMAEASAGARPEEWRWSNGVGTLEFANPGVDVTLHLVLERAVELAEPQTVQVRLGDAVVDEFVLPAAERLWRQVSLPAGAFGDDARQTVTIAADRTFVPSELGVGDDTRELGIRVFHAVLLEE